jgi:hypothetical protein
LSLTGRLDLTWLVDDEEVRSGKSIMGRVGMASRCRKDQEWLVRDGLNGYGLSLPEGLGKASR